MVRTAAGKARASVKTVRASVKTAVFTHRSFAIIRVSGKQQQELAICWRCDRVSKTHGSAIVIDTRTEGSKGLGHRSIGDLLTVKLTLATFNRQLCNEGAIMCSSTS